MLRDAPNINYLFAGLLIEELVRHGVEWFVISPGSRSAPLAWTAASHPRAKTVVHFDERGAAYHALGIAKATLKPAAFICTSGTAAANALPAAVEASYSGIPLVLITADRPERLQGSGANQTINQHGLYREFVRDEKNFAVSAEDFDAALVLQQIDEALARGTNMWPGPVHLNCQFDEPLVPECADATNPDWADSMERIAPWIEQTTPLTTPGKPYVRIPTDQAGLALATLGVASNGVVVLGQLPSQDEIQFARLLITNLSWPVIADVTSGIALEPELRVPFPCIDEAMRNVDALIQVGGPVTSRRLLDALARFPGKREPGRHYIRVAPMPGPLDPFGNVTKRIATDVKTFYSKNEATFRLLKKRDGETRQDFFAYAAAIEEFLASMFTDDAPLSEPAVAYHTSIASSPGDALFLGNSMPIRDADVYRCCTSEIPRIMANRGASGIDGNIATAAGIARGAGGSVTATIGDLAALHDLNSLALLRDIGTPFVLVVLNNNGGGIFHFLPAERHREHFERLFGTPHFLNFERAAEMFGIPYRRPQSVGEFRRMREKALERNGATIIEVRTDRAENLRLHRELDAKIRAALGSPTTSPN